MIEGARPRFTALRARSSRSGLSLTVILTRLDMGVSMPAS
jgi:hypothetical protein